LPTGGTLHQADGTAWMAFYCVTMLNMALELARDRIRVNAIAPGYFSTEFNDTFLASEAGKRLLSRVPMGRAGHLSELDGSLLLLASDAGAFMTGSVITVDGGHRLAMG